jgi:hypothetical protein
MVMPAGDNSLLIHQSLWQYYQQRHLGQVGGIDERVRILLSVSEIPQGVFNMP